MFRAPAQTLEMGAFPSVVRLYGRVCQFTCGHLTFRWTQLNGNSKRSYSRLSVESTFAAKEKIRALQMSLLLLLLLLRSTP